MKKTKASSIGALLIGAILFCGMKTQDAHAANATAARNDNNPIVFSAVARDRDGFVRHNEPLELDCRLLERNTPNTVYSETHRLTSDAMGQLQIPLGSGNATAGDFSEVDFSQPLDLAVYDGATLMTRAPLTQVPAAAFAQQAETARTSTNALYAQTAIAAEMAQKAISAQTARQIEGIAFNDEAAPDKATIWSSEKVARLIGGQGGQGGQTALAKEKTERIAEDLRLLDSIAAHNQRLNDLRDSTHTLELRFNDSIVIVWDSIDALREALRQQLEELASEIGDINYCLVNDAEKGIYTAAIPLYDKAEPESVGLFTNPILKVLRQSGNGDLFADLNLVSFLKKSYRTRVMTYNTSGNAATPAEVYIPASTAELDVYVDNYRIDLPVTYYTYDALVFDLEFYYLGEDITPKLYVTLIRE